MSRLVFTQFETPELASSTKAGISTTPSPPSTPRGYGTQGLSGSCRASLTFVQPPGAGDQSDVLMARYDDIVVWVTHGPADEAALDPVVVRVADCVESLLGP